MLVAPAQATVAEPEWKTVMGARVLFAPIDRAMMRRARRAAAAAVGQDEHGPDLSEEDAAVELEAISDAMSHALITAGVLDWDPVTVATKRLDDAGGEVLDDAGAAIFDPLPFSADALARLLADPVIFDAFDAAYVLPFARRERAKNGFAASSNGTGAAATPATDTASSAATPASRDDAEPVRTAPKRQRPRKQKASGKS